MDADQLEYLRLCAEELIDGSEDGFVDEFHEKRDAIWHRLSQMQRDTLNAVVQAVFGKWY